MTSCQDDKGQMTSENVPSDAAQPPTGTSIPSTKVPTLQWLDVRRSSLESLDDTHPHADFYHNEAGAKTYRKRPSLADLHSHDEQAV